MFVVLTQHRPQLRLPPRHFSRVFPVAHTATTSRTTSNASVAARAYPTYPSTEPMARPAFVKASLVRTHPLIAMVKAACKAYGKIDQPSCGRRWRHKRHDVQRP